jgi:hypothetical protein
MRRMIAEMILNKKGQSRSAAPLMENKNKTMSTGFPGPGDNEDSVIVSNLLLQIQRFISPLTSFTAHLP